MIDIASTALTARRWLKHRGLRRATAALTAVALLIGLLGHFVLPGVVRSQAEQQLTQLLGRRTMIESVAINPFALHATVRGLRVLEPDGAATFASFDELFVNLQAESLFRGAPVLAEIRLAKPYLHVVREDTTRYNFSDLLDLFAGPPTAAEPTRFSLNNLRLAGGRIEFDDRPEGQNHVLDEIEIGLPFLSNLPSQVEVFVEPAFSARANGAQITLAGRLRPFAGTREASVELQLADVDLTRLIAYLPAEPGYALPSARLDAELQAVFRQPADAPPALTLGGHATLRAVNITERDGKPLLELPETRLELGEADVFGRRLRIAHLELQSPAVTLVRRRGGEFNFAALRPAPAEAAKAAPPAAPGGDSPPLALAIDELSLRGARLSFSDEVPTTPFHTTLETIDLKLRGLAVPASAAATLEFSARSTFGETLEHRGEFTLKPFAAGGELRLAGLTLPRYATHYMGGLAARVEQGRLAAAGRYAVSIGGDGEPQVLASELSASLDELALRLPGGAQPAVRIERLGLAGGRFDLQGRRIGFAELVTKGGRVAVLRAADGRLDLAGLLRPAESIEGPAVLKQAAEATAAAERRAPFAVELDRLGVEDWSVRIEDRSMPRPVITTLEIARLSGEQFSSAPGARAQLALEARVNRQGQLSASGSVGAAPWHAALDVGLRSVDLVPLQPFFTDRVNVLVTRATLSGRGRVALDADGAGALRGGFRGDLTVGDFASVDKASAADFLSWKSLHVGGIDTRFAPFALAIEQVALTDFYARVIINADGHLNLQDVAREPEAAPRSVTEAAPAIAAAPAPASSAAPPPMRVGRITLQGGQVNFTDNFIRPNYSAQLMELGGSVAGLSSDPATRAALELRGQVNNAPLEIGGTLNPLSGELALDIKAAVKGMELAPLTPYSAKYVGYGIDKGKLSFDVNYRIEDRQLTADNRLVLDQLSFGERIDSPDATQLPVLLAVALLRDRNGVIDLNLPIGGSLDDPQFSVGRLILRVIGNLIARAVTSPFALLGALFEGGPELSHVAFVPGQASLGKDAEARLEALAKALAERPGLRLEITGRIDPTADREGLKRESIARKLRALKLADAVKQGESVDPQALAVGAAEYPELLRRAYRAESFPKPRNLVGLQKDLPVEEMEKLMLAHASASEDELVELGQQRAQAVKDWLVRRGGVAQERLFLLAVKAAESAGENAASGSTTAAPARVDFSLK